MGLFSFVANAGKKLFGREEDPAPKNPDEAADFAIKLKEEIKAMGLDIEGLGVRYTDGTVTVRGLAADAATKEKIILVVGNTAGVSSVDDQMSVSPPPQPANAPESVVVGPPAPASVFYTVVKGDTLGTIAKTQYGDASAYPRIFDANRPMLKHPDAIYPGQTLRIPQDDPNVATYTVQRGDTLGKIAKLIAGDASKYTAIYEANRDKLSSPDAIQVGQVLRIPNFGASRGPNT